jgi:hypothetical protein
MLGTTAASDSITTMTSPHEIVGAYLAAWSENDPAARASLLNKCWNDEGSIEIGGRKFMGRQAVEEEIATFRKRCPQDRGELTSDIQTTGNWCRFTAAVRRPDGSLYSAVLDIAELGQDGRILRIVTFPQS